LEHLFDLIDGLVRLNFRSHVLNNFALLIDDKLGKVPGNIFGNLLFLVVQLTVLLKESVNLVGVLAVNIALLEEGELGTPSVRSVLLNVLIGVRLLSTELVAREREHLESLAGVLLVKLN